MRTMLAMCSVLMLLGCGQRSEGGGDDPKARTNDVGPIERELRRTTGAPDEGAPSEPTAARAPAERSVGAEREPAARPSRRGVVEPTPSAAASSPASSAVARAPAEPNPVVVAPTADAPDRDGAQRASAVALSRVVLARAIENREPVGAPPFEAEQPQVFLFVEAENAGPEDTSLAVEWIAPDGTRGAPIDLRLPVTPRWRTWASTRRAHRQPGDWTVVVRHAGQELGRETFRVRAPEGDLSSDELAVARSATESAGG